MEDNAGNDGWLIVMLVTWSLLYIDNGDTIMIMVMMMLATTVVILYGGDSNIFKTTINYPTLMTCKIDLKLVHFSLLASTIMVKPFF